MRMGSNRRLANVKTRRETGLDYIMQSIDLNTPFGKKLLKETKPFYPGEEEELKAELDKVEAMTIFVKENSRLVEEIQQIFMEIKDVSYSIERSASQTLTVVEIYEIKSLLLSMRKLVHLGRQGGQMCIPEEYIPADTTELLDILDPRRDRINTFYIYDEFSETLRNLRGQKREFEIAIRKEQKVKRDEIKKEHGIMLTPKFDIVVAKNKPDFEKVKAIEDLEMVDQDYMTATFQLKANEAIYELMRQMDDLHAKLEEEEEAIRKVLSEDISRYADVLLDNCERMGALDVALGKALYAVHHDCTKPEIADEHVIEIEDGRNLQVEDILRSKGKPYCPVSISLADGVTCITGANMGGKTISLKLSGQVAILTQYGFFVPARKARVGLSNYMQILVGDSQSLERGLSTFGSEMEELKEILDHSVERTLLLIDEIASGTNPVEGLALTKALVEYLMEKPYITLMTTHFETVTETEGVINMQVRGLADVNFTLLNREIQYARRAERINIISKYMDYRLYRVEKQGEVPKDALNIAKMLGISSEIIERAKKYIK
ncbi:MAG: DNA mismatch repair protein MutS [Firmicutes bacterium]|nr:DNA mismatch repair protein MutS [Bacillota bacterium]